MIFLDASMIKPSVITLLLLVVNGAFWGAPVFCESKVDDSEAIEDFDDEDKAEQEQKKLRKERKELKRLEAKRKQELIKERKRLEEEREISALVDADESSSTYEVNPESVRLVVELDPGNFGFAGRAHHMTAQLKTDFFLQGRLFLSYDYRFFEYVSMGFFGGIDSTAISLASQVRRQLSKAAPSQFSVMGGVYSKLRLTDWYLNSAIYVEPSVATGYLWQTLSVQNSTHFRLKPGTVFGIESVFDSGLVTNFAIGAEGTFDFGPANPVKNYVEPVVSLGIGMAI